MTGVGEKDLFGYRHDALIESAMLAMHLSDSSERKCDSLASSWQIGVCKEPTVKSFALHPAGSLLVFPSGFGWMRVVKIG